VGGRAARCLPLAALSLCLLLAGCGGDAHSRPRGEVSLRTALARYLAQVEPIRLGVNRLLEGADPILRAYHAQRVSAEQAAARMSALEHQFGLYTVDIAAIQPELNALRELHSEYSHTYVLEDAYLSALAAGLAQHELGNLPATQSAQRAAIISWRTGLAVLARKADLALPADLQLAGRGEIAPSPRGS
jgi:hypothetical protein